MKTHLIALAALASLVGTVSWAQDSSVAYDFKVHSSGLGETRELALKDAIKGARGRCGPDADLVGYSNVSYTQDIGSKWAALDGFCLRHDRVEDDAGSKYSPADNIQPSPSYGSPVGQSAAR